MSADDPSNSIAPASLADETAAAQAKLELAQTVSQNAYMLIAAGVLCLLFLRNVALRVDRFVHESRQRRVRPLGDKTTIVSPFLTRQSDKIDRVLLKPVGVWGIPASWTWLQLLLTSFIVACNLTACLVLDTCVDDDGVGLRTSNYIALRCGYMLATNLPFLYAFAGRNSVISLLTGFEYQTVRTYHKLLGVIVFLEGLVHAITMSVYQVELYGSLHGFRVGEWESPDHYMQFGVAAMSGALVCVFFGMPFIRRRAYEIFLLTHVAGAVILLAGAWYHRQVEIYNWIYAAAAVWAAERAYRFTRFVVTRFGFHRPIIMNAEAQVSHGAILLRVPMGNASWEAGQHCYISFWGSNLLRKPWLYGQSHPFTVSNSRGPGATDMEFVIRVHSGLTKTLANQIIATGKPFVTLPVALEGSYGVRPRSDEFDSVLLVAGGSGITYLASVLSEIVRRSRDFSATKEVKLVWAIHHLNQAKWVGSLLKEAREFADATGLKLSVDLYITRDDTYPHSKGKEVSKPNADGVPEIEKTLETVRPASGSDELGRAELHFVRADVSSIVADFFLDSNPTERKMVLGCGPGGLGDEVREAGAKVARSVDCVYVASFEG